ncbi:MAG: hypothetical protein HKN10_08765 [Myxococcales bacterium]|nr:hypothetical protein [Myxococcales bacterium]
MMKTWLSSLSLVLLSLALVHCSDVSGGPNNNGGAGGVGGAGGMDGGTEFSCDQEGIQEAISFAGTPDYQGETLTFACDAATEVPITETIVIESSVKLDGGGRLNIDGGGPEGSRVLLVRGEGTAVELSRMTIQNGWSDVAGDEPLYCGGGIRNEAILTLTDVVVNGNQVPQGWGGGICNLGELTALEVNVVENRAADLGNPQDNPQRGGGIYNAGTMTLSKVLVSNNVSDFGGGIYNAGTASSGEDCSYPCVEILDNMAQAGSGGGVRSFLDATFTLRDSVIINNEAKAQTNPTSDGRGGGVALYGGPLGALTLERTTVSNNSSARGGGGLFLLGIASIYRSTISDNRTNEQGGGIFAADDGENNTILTLENSTIAKNQAGNGGGLHNEGGRSEANITFCTFFDNSITQTPPSAIHNLARMTLDNSIVQGTCMGDSEGNNNVVTDSSCNDLVPVAATTEQLDQLFQSDLTTLNGGDTATVLPGGKAIDWVQSGGFTQCGTMELDQRGEVRLVGTGCDAGAVELQP